MLNFRPLRNVVPTGRCLPHWEQEGRTYFVRYCTARGLQLPPRARDVVIENLRYWHGDRYVLHQAVVMPDHVHLLITPLAKQEGPQPGRLCHTIQASNASQMWRLREILHTAKSYTANVINRLLRRQGTVWQDESFDRIVRSGAELERRWEYIRNNAVERGLARWPEEYLWLYEWSPEHEGGA